jgi:lipopolysaccharide transport protein LptA
MKFLIFFFSAMMMFGYSNKCFSVDEAIYINSKILEIDYEEGIAEYKKNVFVRKKENFDLYCDKAKIFFATKKSSNEKIKASTGNIKKIELYNNITIVKEPKTAKGDFGIIYPKKKLIVLTGNVALREKTEGKDTYLEGSEVKYYMNTGIFKIKNDVLSNDNKKGRVTVILNEVKKKND